MKIISIVEVKKETLQKSEIKEEHLFRELAIKMVKEMPFEELTKLMEFKKIDPNSQEVVQKLLDRNTSEAEKTKLMRLRQERLFEFSANVDL